MSNNTPKILRNSFLIVFIVVLVAYAIYNSRILIAGPQINISEPQNGATITESPLIRVKGTAENIAFIDINDRMINIDENSFFNEPILLYPGYNVIKISAKDKFDREIEKFLEIIYISDENDLVIPMDEVNNFDNIIEATSSDSTIDVEGFETEEPVDIEVDFEDLTEL